MASLVPELRNAAVGCEVDLLSLLRRVLAVAKLLDIQVIQDWVNYELDGYPKAATQAKAELPNYRIITGTIHRQKPSGECETTVVDRACLPERLFNYELRVGLDWLWTRTQQQDKPLIVPFNGRYAAQVRAAMRDRGEPVLVLSEVDIRTMFQKVRTTVLNWAIDLEKQNIVGENMSFNPKEKASAVNVSIQSNSNNSSGNTTIGNVTDSEVMIDSAGGSQTLNKTAITSPELSEFIKQLKDALPNLSLSEEQNKEMSAEIITLEAQLASPKPKEPIMKESLGTIRDILVGITGSVLASGLLQGLGAFL